MGKQLEFQVHTGKPMIVEVKKDEKVYEIRVGIAIFSVEDAEKNAPDGTPIFNLQANLAMAVKEKT